MSLAAIVTESQPLILHLGPMLQKMSAMSSSRFAGLAADERGAVSNLLLIKLSHDVAYVLS
jgi:hypothetical protein